MNGGIKPDSSRLCRVLEVIAQQKAEVLGIQEIELGEEKQDEFSLAMRNICSYPYNISFDCDKKWTVALFSRMLPSSSRLVSERIKVIEMVFPTKIGPLSICNVYLSYLNERERLPQIIDVLRELYRNKNSILMGDFNALSPEDNIPQSAVDSFSPRMIEKYCRDGNLCYDTIEAVLNQGYIDVGLQFYKPEQITDQTDLLGGTGNHNRPLRMDFIFAKGGILQYLKDFTLVREGLARTASDHFPWHVSLDKSLFSEK